MYDSVGNTVQTNECTYCGAEPELISQEGQICERCSAMLDAGLEPPWKKR